MPATPVVTLPTPLPAAAAPPSPHSPLCASTSAAVAASTPLAISSAAARHEQLLRRLASSGDVDVFLSAVQAFRNGVVYGTRVRAPHALALNLVWGKGPYSAIPGRVLAVTRQHALGLGASGVLLAVVRGALRWVQGGRTRLWHHALAGFCIGALCWGDAASAVHLQMCMYMISRLAFALYHLASGRVGYVAPRHAFRVFAGVLWALTLTMLLYAPDTLQPSMRQSLQYIFIDSAHPHTTGTSSSSSGGGGGSWRELLWSSSPSSAAATTAAAMASSSEASVTVSSVMGGGGSSVVSTL